MIVYYCGVPVGRSAGHFCTPAAGPRTPWASRTDPLGDWHPERDGLRAPVLPYYDQPRGRDEREGEFGHLQVDGWTQIAAWDRSADSRGGSSATFAIERLVGPDEALRIARARFSRVFERIERHIGRAVIVRPAVVARGRS